MHSILVLTNVTNIVVAKETNLSAGEYICDVVAKLLHY